jgi:hypothetical protein
MLSLASIYLLIREKPAWAGYVLLGLCALCRMEAVLLIAIIFFWQWFSIDDKKRIFAGLAAAAAAGLSFYVYAYFKLGAFFPTTRSGKLASNLFNAGISFQGGLNFLERHLAYLQLTQPGALISFGLALAGLAVWALSPRPTRIGPVGILVIFALAVFVYHDQFFRSTATITPFNNFRYQVLFFPALALGLTRILGELFSFLGARWARAMIVILMLGLLGTYSFNPWRGLYRGQCRHIEDVHIRTAQWARASLPPSARIACFDIGSLGFFSGRHIIDLGGLIDPAVDPYLRDKRVGPYLKEQRATHYIELGTPGSERLTGVRQDEGKLYDLAPLAYFPGQRIREPVTLHSWEMKVFEIKWK